MALHILITVLLLLCGSARAEPVGHRIELSDRYFTGDTFMGIRLLGALELKGNKRLAELSGLAWDDAEEILYGVTDRGYLLHMRPELKSGRLTGLTLLKTFPLLDPRGSALSRSWSDAEGLTLVSGAEGQVGDRRLLISFEGRNRIARYTLEGKYEAELVLPKALRKKRFYRHQNKGLEALTMHPRLGLLTGPEQSKGNGPIPIFDGEGNRWFYEPVESDGALVAMEMTKAGDGVLVLERAYSFPLAPWVITLSRVHPKAGNAGEVMEALQIVRFDSTQGWRIQNLEGLTRHRGNRYFVVSDDGGHGYLQTQLLYFEVL